MNARSRAAIEAQYQLIRLAALQVAESLVAATFAPTPVRLSLIGPVALDAFGHHWSGDPRRRYSWPWRDMVEDKRRDEADRFEVAIWSGTMLCGLALGRVRDAFCGIEWLEGHPAPEHPLRGSVTVAAAGAAAAYATALGKQELRFLNPLPGVVPQYQAIGFLLASHKGQPSYCWRKIP